MVSTIITILTIIVGLSGIALLWSVIKMKFGKKKLDNKVQQMTNPNMYVGNQPPPPYQPQPNYPPQPPYQPQPNYPPQQPYPQPNNPPFQPQQPQQPQNPFMQNPTYSNVEGEEYNITIKWTPPPMVLSEEEKQKIVTDIITIAQSHIDKMKKEFSKKKIAVSINM